MTPHVSKLAISLVITSVFDREVNCRRAASAAFQENVGRQVQIQLLLIVQGKLSSWNRHLHCCRLFHSFQSSRIVHQDCSVYCTVKYFHYSNERYKEYTTSLIDHLVNVKIQHWERSLRELTAKALNSICVTDPTYIHDVSLPQLV